jgi:hypothetical protein
MKYRTNGCRKERSKDLVADDPRLHSITVAMIYICRSCSFKSSRGHKMKERVFFFAFLIKISGGGGGGRLACRFCAVLEVEAWNNMSSHLKMASASLLTLN